MPEAFNEISPAIPCGALTGIVLKLSFTEKQEFPSGDDRAEIEREGEFVRRNAL